MKHSNEQLEEATLVKQRQDTVAITWYFVIKCDIFKELSPVFFRFS